jgi:hypothetical protein
VDRGRIVREALAILLADLDAASDKSLVARRLRATSTPERNLPGRTDHDQ